MLLMELDKKEKTPENIQDSSAALKTDTRKTRLTLEQLSKLRKLSDLKAAEYQASIKEIRKQFAPAPAA
tara:strand:- start:327 stop:533 length:207 start_codon:yes stop_codon:yes gene_type:complete